TADLVPAQLLGPGLQRSRRGGRFGQDLERDGAGSGVSHGAYCRPPPRPAPGTSSAGTGTPGGGGWNGRGQPPLSAPAAQLDGTPLRVRENEATRPARPRTR